MISHLLTSEQAAIVRAGGTMLPIEGDEVRGDPCQLCENDFKQMVTRETHGHEHVIRVAPRAWLTLTEPCETCDGRGVEYVQSNQDCSCGFGGFHDDINPRCNKNVRHPCEGDCVDGSKIIDLEEAVPCERGGEDIWAHVLVARATIQLLPVVADLGGRLPYPQVCVAERVTDQYLREWYVDADGDQMHRMINPTPDPLPVEEQDWVAALTIIERTS